ncbi:MAG TPA: hypothetical protein DD624_04920 [Alphaproteobacteria bacterium]|nr:hypothetical protein [Alphaproteobacteria bacterium]
MAEETEMTEAADETQIAEEENIERNHNKAKKLQKLKDESSVTFFLHAALFMFFTTAFTFLFFLYKNKYPLILNNEVLPEVLFSCVGLLIISLFCLFLLSFWRLLGRAFLAVVTGACGAYILGLVYPDNIGVYIGGWLPFLPRGQAKWLAENGNMLAGVGIGTLFFVCLNLCKGAAMAFLSLPVLGALLLLMNTASKQVSPQIVQKKASVFADEQNDEKTQNLIYLILADHAGYKAAVEEWKSVMTQSKNPMAEPNSPAFINAFYQTNGFAFYPSAYLPYPDRYRNVGSAVNPSEQEVSSKLFSRDDASYFVSSEDARVFLLRNALFKDLNEKGYKINVYQTYPFDFCKGFDGEVDKCVTYPAPLGALYQTDLSVADRVMLLVGHFLNSSSLGKKLVADMQRKPALSDLPFVANPLAYSLPVGQSGVLYRLTKDAETAKGKNVFFAHVDLPHYPYMYDENCNLVSDPMKWRFRGNDFASKKDLSGDMKNRQAYMRQLACTYGQLNYMLKDLKDSGTLANTKIVIHGDHGDGLRKNERMTASLTQVQMQIDRVKRDMTTVFAVYDPDAKKATVEKGACDVPTLVNKYVLDVQNGACRSPDMSKATEQEKDEILKWLSEPVDDAWLKKENYAPIYTAWREKGGQAFMARVAQRQQQSDKVVADSDKMMFIAPPLEKSGEKAVDAPKEAFDFVPVPDAEKADAPAEEDVPPLFDEQQEQPSDEKQKEQAGGFDLLDDAFADVPAPMQIPETQAEEKWKTVQQNENDGKADELFADVPPPPAETEENAKTEAAPADEKAEQTAVQAETRDLPLPEETIELPTLDFAEPSLTDLEQAASVDKAKEEMEAQKKAAEEAAAQAELKAKEEARKKAEEEAELAAKKAAEDAAEKAAKEEAEAAAQAKLKAEEEARKKEEAARAVKEAEAKAKAEAELRAKIEAEVRAKLEAEAKAKAEQEARLKAEIETKLRAEAEAKARREAEEAQEKAEQAARIQKAIDDAVAKQKAAEEARLREEAEAAAKKAFPPAENTDLLDKTHEVITERTNRYGETETYIFIERQPNPKRYEKKNREKELQQDLIRLNPQEKDVEAKAPEPEKQAEKQPQERVLGTETADGETDAAVDSAKNTQTPPESENTAAVEKVAAVPPELPAEPALAEQAPSEETTASAETAEQSKVPPMPEGRELTD